jgi:hypothetical protein
VKHEDLGEARWHIVLIFPPQGTQGQITGLCPPGQGGVPPKSPGKWVRGARPGLLTPGHCLDFAVELGPECTANYCSNLLAAV